MRRLITVILFSIFLSTFLKAEIVNQIQISGNKRVSNETVMIYGNINSGKDYTEQDLNKILNNLYSTNFFKDVKINLKNGNLKINLVEYSVINQLIILGEDSSKYKEQIRKILISKEKDSFIKTNISKDVEVIKKLYSSVGYNLVTVDTKFNELESGNKVDLIFEINRGETTKISKIVFTGDKKIRQKRLRDIIASEESKFWKLISRNTKYSQRLVNLDLRLLSNYYKSLGYYDVKITSNSAEIKKSGNVELTYSIEAGNRYIIKKITTNVDPVFDKKLFLSLNKEYQEIIGEYYSPFKIKALLEDIDNLIEQKNLQFVEHNVEEIIEDSTIIIKFNIFEGKKVSIERINILGNNVTNESVIRGELLIDEGDPFTNLNLDKSIARIKSRNLFQSVTSTQTEGTTPNLKIIDINVEEKATGEISAGAGVGTSGGSIAFNIKENNWLGEGKKVGFEIELSNESLKGKLDYTNPNYDFLGNAINYTLYSSNNDKPTQGYENTLIGAGVTTSFEQYKDLYAKLGLNASYDNLKTQSSASSSLKKHSGTYNEIAGLYGFTYDKRNRSFMPTDGYISSFTQELPLYSDKGSISNTLATSLYKTVTENIIGASKFYFKSVNGIDDDTRLSKRVNISDKRLRGFEKGKIGPVDNTDHVGGNYAAAANFEVLLPNFLPEDTKTDISFFLDFANVWEVDYNDAIDDSNKIRSSTGVAASWISPLGPMTFVLATNISKASTDQTEAFNFNLGTTF